jgi:hypothetical protein
VNQASAQQIGTMWGKSYVVTPGGIMVPPESPITKPEQLAGQEIAVGYHSGSHFTTIQALEQVLAHDQIKLKFVGMPWARVDVAVQGEVPATSVWGLTFQVLEQLGFRKVADTSFMIGFMFPFGVDPTEVENYMNGLKRAQMDLDFEPERYKRLYLNEIPERYKSKVDVRRFSTGERVVFLPYTKEMYAKGASLDAGTRTIRRACYCTRLRIRGRRVAAHKRTPEVAAPSEPGRNRSTRVSQRNDSNARL